MLHVNRDQSNLPFLRNPPQKHINLSRSTKDYSRVSFVVSMCLFVFTWQDPHLDRLQLYALIVTCLTIFYGIMLDHQNIATADPREHSVQVRRVLHLARVQISDCCCLQGLLLTIMNVAVLLSVPLELCSNSTENVVLREHVFRWFIALTSFWHSTPAVNEPEPKGTRAHTHTGVHMDMPMHVRPLQVHSPLFRHNPARAGHSACQRPHPKLNHSQQAVQC